MHTHINTRTTAHTQNEIITISDLSPENRALFDALDDNQQYIITRIFSLNRKSRAVLLATLDAYIERDPVRLECIQQSVPELGELTAALIKRLEVSA